MKKSVFFSVLLLSGCNEPFMNLPPKKSVFTYNMQSFNALYLYRSKDQEIGFKNNPEKLPIVFTWVKPIEICFNMKNVKHDLYIYYFDKNKKLIGNDLMAANSNKRYCPSEKILYAIEIENLSEVNTYMY